MLFLVSVALSADPQVFEPLPVDHVTPEGSFRGILIDEATFQELIQLRTDSVTYQREIKSFEEWKAQEDRRFTKSLSAVKLSCEEGQKSLMEHYEGALTHEKKKDFLQRHGFSVGVALGLVGATALYIGATRFYGKVLSVEVGR